MVFSLFSFFPAAMGIIALLLAGIGFLPLKEGPYARDVLLS